MSNEEFVYNSENIEIILDKSSDITVEEASKIMKQFLKVLN